MQDKGQWHPEGGNEAERIEAHGSHGDRARRCDCGKQARAQGGEQIKEKPVEIIVLIGALQLAVDFIHLVVLVRNQRRLAK